MKKFLKFMPVALAATMTVSLASCSDDDEPENPGKPAEPTTENVFTEGLPASIDGATFTTNANGQVTKIEEGTESTTFEYGTFTPSRADAKHTFTVLMKIRDTQYPEDGSDIYMEINKQGFVAYAYQVPVDTEDGTDEWWFEYNADGQLTRLKRTEGGDDFKITYTNGDATKVNGSEEDGDTKEYTISYTNDNHKTAVANKGNIMLFDETLGVDMDEMDVAYYAGLLGKSTKNLPMGSQRKGVEGSSSYTDDPVVFNWEFNSNGFPTKFWEDDNTYDTITFSWK